MPKHQARITVTLPRTISGNDLVEAVRAIVDKSSRNWFVDETKYRNDDEFLVIGQASSSMPQNLRVRAVGETKHFRADDAITEVIVESHLWENYGEYEMSVSYPADYRDAASAFADAVVAQVGEG